MSARLDILDPDLDADPLEADPPPATIGPQIIAWREIPIPPLPDHWDGVLTITPTEFWCAACGSDGATTPGKMTPGETLVCYRCGSRSVRLVVDVLRPGEYVLR